MEVMRIELVNTLMHAIGVRVQGILTLYYVLRISSEFSGLSPTSYDVRK